MTGQKYQYSKKDVNDHDDDNDDDYDDDINNDDETMMIDNAGYLPVDVEFNLRDAN